MVATRKKLFYLILLSSVVRIAIGYFLEFGNDEVYYWTYAQHLQWNYFDHPPMVALLIRLGTLGLQLHHEIFVRAGSILCAALNTWLIFLIGKKIRDEKAGWYAALLYTSSFYCSVIAGTFILPDSPQLIFWVLSIYLMMKILEEPKNGARQNLLWLLTGLCIGLCILSKVHGVFLWFGFGMYILLYQRSVFRLPAFYGAILLTAVTVSPILLWNMQNHFITYTFHQSRVGFFDKKLDWDSFLQQLLGSALYNNPINFVLYIIGIIGILKFKDALDLRYKRLLFWLSLPLILVLLIMSLFNETLPHWSGPAYISILLMTGVYFSYTYPEGLRIPRGILAANLLLLFAAVAGILVIKYIPLQLGKKESRVLGDGDVTLDMVGWRKFGTQFDSLYRQDLQSGIMKPHAFLISDKWFPAANLDFYVSSPHQIPIFATGKLVDIHHYAWLNKERQALQIGEDAYFVYPTNYANAPKEALKKYFEQVDSTVSIPQFRSGIHARDFVITRLHHYKGGLPADGVTPD